MNKLYQRTFDRLEMPEEAARSIRASLALHCSPHETEVISMKKTIVHRSATFLVAAILIAMLSVGALAGGIYYYVSYDVRDGVGTPEGAIDLTGQNADFEAGDYEYREENGVIIADIQGEVSYEMTNERVGKEGGETVDLTEQEADFEGGAYRYTAENGKITANWDD